MPLFTTPTKTTDANGWDIYNYGSYKVYRKRYTNSSYAFATGETDNVIYTTAMPVGVTLTDSQLSIIQGQNVWAVTSWASSFIKAIRPIASGGNITINLHFSNGSGATNNWAVDYIIEAIV